MKRKLATVFVTLLLLVSMFSFLRLDPKTSATTASKAFEAQNSGESSAPSAPPVIQDFHVNSTWAGQTSTFSFNVSSPSGDLASATLSTNITSSFTNDTVSVSGGVAWANFTKTLTANNCTVAFDFWVFDTNASLYATTGLRLLKVYAYNGTVGAWNTPFVSLGSALQNVDSANNWTGVDVYDQYILGHNSTSLETMIDSYDASHDWVSVLYWSAVCNKLNITRQQAIRDALGNYTMVGSLPATMSGPTAFSPESKWALYGYWYANSSWANANMTKWNITAAYQTFNSTTYSYGAPMLYMYGGYGAVGSGSSFERYYDEGACTIECYLIFYTLLNVTGALNDAVYWWNWTNSNLWVSNHYEYKPGYSGYECEAPFFLKIISMLKYYDMPLQNWANVLTDISNRFLSSEWNSYQWLDGNTGQTTYVVVHMYPNNPQRRLGNTLGTWQALEGTYLQLYSTYEQNIVDMLCGNQATEPAWALLLTPQAGLFNVTANMFSFSSESQGVYHFANDPNATAQGEILLFMLGIVPQTTTVAFPLEELSYEYIKDIDPTTLNMNVSTRTLTVPVNSAGTLIFQYGVSPITQQFNSSGVYRVVLSGSWNNIASVTRTGDLPKAGFPVTPEFPSTTILTIFMALTAFVAVLVKKKRLKRLY